MDTSVEHATALAKSVVLMYCPIAQFPFLFPFASLPFPSHVFIPSLPSVFRSNYINMIIAAKMRICMTTDMLYYPAELNFDRTLVVMKATKQTAF